MSDWVETTVGDVVARCYSGPSPTCEERNVRTDQEWGLLKTTAVTWAGWNEWEHKVPPSIYWHNKAIEVRPGDVLVTKAGPRHRVGVVVDVRSTQPRLMVSGKMIGLTPKFHNVMPQILAGVLATGGPQKYLDQRTTGMAESQVNFTNEVLLATPILIPTVHEQYRIAEILKAVDETMRLTRNLIAKLVQIKQGMRRHLLTCGVGDDGRPRDPEKNPELFRHSPIGSIPRDWTVARLGSLVEILDNLRVPVSGEERLLRQGSVPYYGANGQQGFIDRALFDEPLILLAEDGGFFDEFATRAIAYRIDGPSWVNNHAHVLRACGINFEYLFQSLEHRDIRRFIAGGTRSKLIQSELRAIPIPVAPKAEQIVLAEALRTQDTLVSMEEAHLRVLEGVRRGLLVDLLTGRVRVKGDEAAA